MTRERRSAYGGAGVGSESRGVFIQGGLHRGGWADPPLEHFLMQIFTQLHNPLFSLFSEETHVFYRKKILCKGRQKFAIEIYTIFIFYFEKY